VVQNLIFRFLQNKSKIKIWLFNNDDLSIEGQIIGFDEYMNLVLDNAEEVCVCVYVCVCVCVYVCESEIGKVRERERGCECDRKSDGERRGERCDHWLR